MAVLRPFVRLFCVMMAVVSFTVSFAVTVSMAYARADGQNRSWTFEQLLRPPATAELQKVDDDWSRKAWSVDNISLRGTASAPVGAHRFQARVYTHTLNGSRRCGVVLLPPGAAPESLAALVDIGDISWDYPDRDLTNGPYVARILSERASEFALIVPCARGMGIRIGEIAAKASGDRRDAWEGAAEDAIAFLTAALSVTPQIDADRIGVYGYSRGGGVALIVGQRDRRIKALLAFAAPTEWFSAMGRPGVNWPERLEQASRDPSLQRDTRENQYLDWFVRDREHLPLAELRRRLVAASPLYFAEKLPPFQIHHGEQDGPVPVRNATALRDRLGSVAGAKRQVFTYQDAGHSLDKTSALKTAQQFLVEHLLAQGKRLGAVRK